MDGKRAAAVDDENGIRDDLIVQPSAAVAAATTAKPFEPVDKFRIVYIIFILHGIGTLMPWNMFINAFDYFVNYKLAPPGGGGTFFNGTTYDNETTTDGSLAIKDPTGPTVYQAYFLNVLGFVAQVPGVLLNAVNFLYQKEGGISAAVRIVWSIIVVIVMFVFTLMLAIVDSSQWIEGFFWTTMVTVVIINMANGMYQNSIFGSSAILPMKYTNAVVVGSNVSGTFTSLLNLITMASTPDLRTSAIYYFLAAVFVLMIAFNSFYLLELLPFYQHHKLKSVHAVPASESDTPVSSTSGVRKRPNYLEIFKKCWVHDLCVFFVFFVTLTCFPAIQATIKLNDEDFFIPDFYFSAITCFLFFNLFALLGNITSAFIQLPGPRWLWIPVLLRAVFIPFFMFCNAAASTLPVLVANDYVYCIGSILFGYTSGYLSSLAMMYAPGNVEPADQCVAGMMASFFLVLGIFAGITFATPVKLLMTM